MSALIGFYTDAAKNKVNNLWHRQTAITTPTSLSIGLSANTSSRLGTVSEPSAGAGYARVSTTSTSWNVSATGQTTNSLAIPFPTPTGSWGTVKSVFAVANDGTVVWMADLTVATAIATGQVKTFAIGSIVVQL